MADQIGTKYLRSCPQIMPRQGQECSSVVQQYYLIHYTPCVTNTAPQKALGLCTTRKISKYAQCFAWTINIFEWIYTFHSDFQLKPALLRLIFRGKYMVLFDNQ